MAIVRLDPFREVDTLQREMNRLFSDLFPTAPSRNDGLAFMPPAELEDTPEAYHVSLEIPGIKPDELNIEVTADALSITGERKSEKTAEGQGVTRSEFRYGRFQRVIALPGRVDSRDVNATYQDGILQVRLPKLEEEKSKVVKVSIK